MQWKLWIRSWFSYEKNRNIHSDIDSHFYSGGFRFTKWAWHRSGKKTSANIIYEIITAEKLSKKTENEIIEKSTFAQEITQPTTAEIDTEKVSKDPVFSETTTANNKPKHDTHTQKEKPKNEKSESEITTNTVSKAATADKHI